jgi:hypothetical protein
MEMWNKVQKDTATRQSMLGNGDLEKLMHMAVTACEDAAAVCICAVLELTKDPALGPVWNHFDNQYLFRASRDLSRRATNESLLKLLAVYIQEQPGALETLARERVLDSLLRFEPTKEAAEETVREVKCFNSVAAKVKFTSLPVWNALKGRGQELLDLLISRLGKGSEDTKEFAFRALCELRDHPEMSQALPSARTVNALLRTAGKADPKAMASVLQILGMVFQEASPRFLQSTYVESIWKLPVLRLETEDNDLVSAVLSMLVHAAESSAGVAMIHKLGCIQRLTRCVSSKDLLVRYQALLVLQRLGDTWGSISKSVCQQVLKENMLQETIRCIEEMLDDRSAGNDTEALRLLFGATLSQAGRPLGSLRDPTMAELGCAAALALQSMMQSNHITKQLGSTRFDDVMLALLKKDLAPRLVVGLVAARLAKASPSDEKGNAFCMRLQDAGVLPLFGKWLGPNVGLSYRPSFLATLKALATLSKMEAFDRKGESYDLPAAVSLLLKHAYQPNLGLMVFLILRNVLRQPEQLEMVRAAGALDWFQACQEKYVSEDT